MLIACFVLPHLGLACERARLPHVELSPLALAGEDGKLCVVSEEATARGLLMGQTVSSARALCGDLVVLPYDRPAYESAARCLWDLFAVESSIVEPVSPERCYVEMPGRDVEEILERVQALAGAIAKRVGIPIQVGLSASKFVALQAAAQPVRGGRADMEADPKVIVVPVGREAAFLAPVPLESLPGLEFPVRQRLQRMGLKTFGDVLALPSRRLQRQFRDLGLLLQRFATGLDGERVRPLWPPPSLCREVAFEEEVCDEATIHEALRQCAEEIARALAQRREFCRALTLTVGLIDHTYLQEWEQFSLPVNTAAALWRGAMRLLCRLRIDRPLVEIALKASELGVGSGVQLALLDDNRFGQGLPHERRARLQTTLAYLRRRFPQSAPILASLLRQARRVGLWTYPLGHLLNRPVEVATTRAGEPARYWGSRYRRLYQGEVRRVHTRWKETVWSRGDTMETSVWRVETDENGLCELHQLGIRWSLGAVAD